MNERTICRDTFCQNGGCATDACSDLEAIASMPNLAGWMGIIHRRFRLTFGLLTSEDAEDFTGELELEPRINPLIFPFVGDIDINRLCRQNDC